MPAGDYTPVTTGALKLKGVNPSSKVGKHKKKRPKPNETTSSSKIDSTLQAAEDENGSTAVERTAESKEKDIQDTITSESKEEESQSRGKTEAELRHEERRRRRLDERLKREGTKTHKERVEELNRYLSNLSEHHDMPRIGPG